MKKIKNWINYGNDCAKCKYCWESRSSYECDEWDGGCYIKGEDYDEKPCRLINPFKWIVGTLAKRKANYYADRQWDGYAEFVINMENRDEKLHELVMSKIINDNIICWKDKDGTLHEYNTESYIRNNIWEVRYAYDDFAHPVIYKKLSTEWKELLRKTRKYFYKKNNR